MPQSGDGLRLDVWLYRTRLLKTRALATKLVTNGKVRITRHANTLRTRKAGFKLAPDDELSFMRGSTLFQIRVIGLPECRGPAAEAQTFYERLTDL